MDMKRLAVVVCLTVAEELFEERSRGQSRQVSQADAVRRVRRCRDRLEAVWVEAAGYAAAGKADAGPARRPGSN
jgi:ferredoxin